MALSTWYRAATVVAVIVAVTVPAMPAGAVETRALADLTEVEVAYESGELAAPASAENAYSYDETLAPYGAELQVIAVSGPSAHAIVVLTASGLLPDREYGAHLHTKPCGATGAAAGPHYQHEPDPVQPSTDPAYANAENEVWLDFTTDSQGTGVAYAKQAWSFTAPLPGALVVHAEHTHTGSGEAGTAGARLACLTIAF